MCGLKIGIAGRTGNFSPANTRTQANNYQPNSKYPDHVHLDDGYGSHTTGILSFRNEIDEFNRICIPNYDYPLLLPCHCFVSLQNENPSGCNFNQSFANTCWAGIELRCPHIWNNRNRRIQAQLRRLGLYPETRRINGQLITLLIDGLWGNLPTSATSTISNTRQGIYTFKSANNLLVTLEGQAFNPANYDMNPDTDDEVLNNLVPINVDAPN
jgi:hypothetical protein